MTTVRRKVVRTADHRPLRVRVAMLAVLVCASIALAKEPGRWTIQCLELPLPEGSAVIRRIAESLRRTPGVRAKDVFVADESDGYARLYYGRYRRKKDRKTGVRSIPRKMRADMDLLRQLGDSSNRRYFTFLIPVRVPQPDVGNPAWVLRNARGTYSLQVAVFEPTDEFGAYKQAAAEYCSFLRKKGYEAYYHHTRSSSMVTVGVFGPEAVETVPGDGQRYSAEVLRMQRDPLLKYNLVNGAVHRVRNESTEKSVTVPSFLVRIPNGSSRNAP